MTSLEVFKGQAVFHLAIDSTNGILYYMVNKTNTTTVIHNMNIATQVHGVTHESPRSSMGAVDKSLVVDHRDGSLIMVDMMATNCCIIHMNVITSGIKPITQLTNANVRRLLFDHDNHLVYLNTYSQKICRSLAPIEPFGDTADSKSSSTSIGVPKKRKSLIQIATANGEEKEQKVSLSSSTPSTIARVGPHVIGDGKKQKDNDVAKGYVYVAQGDTNRFMIGSSYDHPKKHFQGSAGTSSRLRFISAPCISRDMAEKLVHDQLSWLEYASTTSPTESGTARVSLVAGTWQWFNIIVNGGDTELDLLIEMINRVVDTVGIVNGSTSSTGTRHESWNDEVDNNTADNWANRRRAQLASAFDDQKLSPLEQALATVAQ
jgi:hypothetical protein